MVSGLKQPKAFAFIPKKIKVSSEENIYDLKIETAAESIKLFKQGKYQDTFIWYISQQVRFIAGKAGAVTSARPSSLAVSQLVLSIIKEISFLENKASFENSFLSRRRTWKDHQKYSTFIFVSHREWFISLRGM